MIRGVSPNDVQRIKSPIQHDPMDTQAEEDFEDLIKLVAQICDNPTVHISLVGIRRKWLKDNAGIDIKEVSHDFTFCLQALNEKDLLIITDTTKDERFQNIPVVTGTPKIRFYAGMPLISAHGHKLGTLCLIDYVPKTLTKEQSTAMRTVARQIVNQIDLRLERAELKKQNNVNNTLLSIVSHDLKSPVNSLSSLLELMDKSNLTREEINMLMERIKEAFRSTKDLLDNLLHWATSHFNATGLKMEPISLKPLVDDEINSSVRLIEKKNNTIENKIHESVFVLGDYNSLRFVIRNLLLNANKFTEEGRITIAAQEENEKIKVDVADSGQGIGEDAMKHIFNWNTRSKSEGTKGEKGSGIGLKICKDLIEQHGGTIWINSEPKKGSTFHFMLPAWK